MSVWAPATHSVELLPINEPLTVAANGVEDNAFNQLIRGLTSRLLEDELLPAEEAFQLQVTVKEDKTLTLTWAIAEG
jgi:thiol:disulfide interchange protein